MIPSRELRTIDNSHEIYFQNLQEGDAFFFRGYKFKKEFHTTYEGDKNHDEDFPYTDAIFLDGPYKGKRLYLNLASTIWKVFI